jgi:glycosyltransferase involved in cell wall biosynthesis
VANESGVGKKWDILYTILAGDEDHPPFVTRAIAGPPELIEDDDDFHALKLRDPAMTQQLARALEAIDESDLEERYYRVDLSDAYNKPTRRDAEDFSRVLNAFRLLRDFFSAASAEGDGVTIQLWG